MIIWLASYPKSGNTWLRAIITSLLYTEDGQFNFDLLKQIQQFPNQKYFAKFTNDFTNIKEIKNYWIKAQEEINLNNKINFLKTHHINCKIDNHDFTNKLNTLATIYIVRDPRNLINSIANHYDLSINDSKEFLITSRTLGSNQNSNTLKDGHVVTLLGSWAEHYRFWKQNNENYLIIKYENLLNDMKNELEKIILFLKNFINFEINENKLNNIIKTTNFENLKKGEQIGLFNENAYTKNTKKKINFFHQGPKNDWKSNLDNKIIDEINFKLRNEMIELGYL